MAKKKATTKKADSSSKQLASLQEKVKNATTPEAQKSALAKLNSYRASIGQPSVTTDDIGSRTIADTTAREGTRTTGTTLGQVREINPSSIEKTKGMESANITPTTVINPRDIGAVERAQAATLAPTAQMQGVTIAPQQQVGLDNQFRTGQQGLAGALEQQAAGQGPSLAKLQLQEALERSLKGQMGALGAQPGVSQALAARLFGYQAGQQNQQSAMAAAQARMAEQLSAQQQLAALYAQGRGADIAVQQANQAAVNNASLQQSQLDAATQSTNVGALNQAAQQQAALQQQIALANQQAANERQVQQADVGTRVDLSNQLAQNTQAYNQAQLLQQANQFNADVAYKTAVQQAQLQQEAAKSNQAAFNEANTAQGQIAGGVKQSGISASGQVGAASASAAGQVNAQRVENEGDITVAAINKIPSTPTVEAPNSNPTLTGSDKKFKKDVKSGGAEADDMMEKLAAAIFKYKNPEQGEGKQVGVLAQDLEKSKLGKQMVEDHGDGKYINFAKGLGAALAAQAELHQRMKKLEARA